jgi:hypothetical protein
MLYLRNTNQLQSLDRGIQRGPADTPPVPPTPVTSSYFDGLGRQAYSAYIDPFTNPNGYATGSTTGSLVADSGSLQAIFASGSANISNQWLGYFKASTNETYSFFLFNDDNSVLWLGNSATASVLTTGSALLKSLTGTPTTGSISLTSGSYYPIRIQYADGAGARYFTASFSTPTITKTTDFTNYTFCNTASLGF